MANAFGKNMWPYVLAKMHVPFFLIGGLLRTQVQCSLSSEQYCNVFQLLGSIFLELLVVAVRDLIASGKFLVMILLPERTCILCIHVPAA